MKYLLVVLLFFGYFSSVYSQSGPSQEIQGLIQAIGGKGIVYGKYVGFAGSTPREFVAFEQFVRKASLEDMEFYLQHEDASIRAYAFWGIAIKKPEIARNLLKELRTDKEEISTMMGGCIMNRCTVDVFRKEILNAPMNELFLSQNKRTPKPTTKSSDY